MEKNNIEKSPVAVITGASQGIGKACAMGLACQGYQTVLIARDESKLQSVAKEILKIEHPSIVPPRIEPLDVNNNTAVLRLVQEVKKDFGRIDVLINNAGLTIKGTLNMDYEEFGQLLKTNLQAPFTFLKAVVPVMKSQHRGYIFNIASRAGKYGFAKSGGYSASKFGLVGLSESLYRELAQEGISVTSICPGWVDTEMAQTAGTPLTGGEMIQAEDIVKTIQWILGLSSGACVREVLLESPKSIL